MVATRRGTRVIPQEEEKRSGPEDAGGQPAMEVSTPSSQVQTRNRVKRDSQSEDNSDKDRDVESTVSTGPPELPKPGVQILTRSRRKSGQSDGDISEADSTASSHSTRRSRSRQPMGHLTESARKLRSQVSRLVSEPILESKEDSELSEAESNGSSVSTKASKRPASAVSKSALQRNRRSVVFSEPVISIKDGEDVSEVESNCSSVSGVQRTRRPRITRSRQSDAKCAQSAVKESPVIEISDAESCSSGISSWSVSKRASRRNNGKSQQLDKEENIKEAKSLAVTDVVFGSPIRSHKRSSETITRVMSPSRRSLRIRQIDPKDDAGPSTTEQTGNTMSHAEVKADSASFAVESLTVDFPCTKSELSAVPNKAISEQIDLTDELERELIDVEEQPTESSVSNKDTKSILTDKDCPASSKDKDVHDGSSILLFKDRKTPDGVLEVLLDSDASSESAESSSEDNGVEDEGENDKPIAGSVIRTKPAPSEHFEDALFVIDTKPGLDSSKKYYQDNDDEEQGDGNREEEEPQKVDDSEEEFDEEEDEDDLLLNKPNKALSLSTSIDTGLKLKDIGGLYINFDAAKPNPGASLLQKMKKGHKKADELLKNSVITPDFEKKDCVPSHKELTKQLKKQRKEEKEKSTGRGWFDMKAPELTDELKNDLKALKMRSALDPKRFYKKNDRDGFPKYFQVGTVVDSSVDFYHSRIPKKERKRTIVEELLADAEFRRYNKRKFQEIMSEKSARAEGKKNRKKKKFRQ
uniref:Fcf2 pre-rRNA processing C-terminal domain-containing protein n=1 Tax=Leptobrachium leishanense TaxID=445787 RepID=A0A8C5MJ48_9ANUR